MYKKMLVGIGLLGILTNCATTKSPDLQNQVKQLETQLKEKRMDISGLESKVGNYSKQIQELETENAKINAKLELLKNSDKGTMQSKLLVAESEMDTLKKENQKLMTDMKKIETLKSENLRMKTELEKAMKKYRGTSVDVDSQGIVKVLMVSQILFEFGESILKEDSKKILDDIAKIIKKYPERLVSIEGHTDNLRIINSPKYESNWELAATRAGSVIRYLQNKYEIDGKTFRLSSYASYKPVADNETMEGRAKNRRVEILLFPEKYDVIKIKK